jgi:hypothetical protein
MSTRSKALLVGFAAFVVGALVVYVVAKVIIGLVVVLGALAAGLVIGVASYNYVLGRPLGDRPWRR